MWSDCEAEKDLLNFKHVADLIAQMVLEAKGKPFSVGISGGWGTGKSSMVKLVQESLERKEDGNVIVVEFNAWLYQGYDDARAALLDVIAKRLIEKSKGNETARQKAKDLLKRVNWLRLAGLGGMSAVALSLGLPPVGLVGEAAGVIAGLLDGDVTSQDLASADAAGKKVGDAATGVVKPKAVPASPPQQIHALRSHFEETLQAMGVTLVVVVDDLDRCLPRTAVATLEAMRLFLFLKHTAFIIAADDKMIWTYPDSVDSPVTPPSLMRRSWPHTPLG